MNVSGNKQYFGIEVKALVRRLLPQLKARLPAHGSPVSYLIACLLTLLAVQVRLAVAPIEAGLQYLTFFPAVTLAAVLGGFGPGLLATLLGTVLATVIFTAPYYTLSLLNVQASLWSNIVFVLDGLIVCSSIEAMHRFQRKYRRKLSALRMNTVRVAGINQVLKDREAFSLSIFDSRSEQVAVLDGQGVIIAVNAAWRRFAADNGAPARTVDAVGQNYLDICRQAARHPGAAEMPAVMAGIDAVMRGMMSEFEMEYPCHAPGIERWFSMRVTPLQGGQGGVVVAHENISKRKAMEKALMHHKAIVESSEDAIIGETREGVVSSWNRGAERLFGYRREEILGRPAALLIPEAGRQEHQRILENVRNGITMKHYQSVWLGKGERRVDVSVAISPLRGPVGNVVGASIVARDIAEQKRIEEEQRIAATAFEAQEGMVVTDADKIILRVNRAFALNSGYSAEELVGRHIRLLTSGRHPASFYAEMWQVIGRDGAWQGEVWNRRRNGEIYPEWLTITAVKNAAGETTHYVGTHTDITSRKAAEDEIRYLAFYDPLTRLPNRRLLMDRLHQTLAASSRLAREGALMFIDMDNFKRLNDTLGHDKGDLLLQEVARRLVACVREGDTVARLGGDEFVVILELLSGDAGEAAAQAEAVSRKILAALNQTYQLGEHEFHSTPSIGITLFGRRQRSGEELLKEADAAMYQAKSAGRNGIRLYSPGGPAAA